MRKLKHAKISTYTLLYIWEQKSGGAFIREGLHQRKYGIIC